MIDWRMDTEKKLWNLVRVIRQDVQARGDAACLLEQPSVNRNSDGSYTVNVFKAETKASAEPSPAPKKATTKRKSSRVDDDDDSDDE